jgi:hypothetical protein
MVTDNIEQHIPRYLTPAQQSDLVEQLRDFHRRPVYTSLLAADVLQGDCWTSFQIFDFDSGKREGAAGIIFSNSYDIDPSNNRVLPPKLVFAPLIRLDSYEAKLRQAGTLKAEQIDSTLEAIRKQQITSMFYLPKGGGLPSEAVAVLDDVHSMPLKSFSDNRERRKLVTLNQLGFYLFVLKLSIHFCRFFEGISRG